MAPSRPRRRALDRLAGLDRLVDGSARSSQPGLGTPPVGRVGSGGEPPADERRPRPAQDRTAPARPPVPAAPPAPPSPPVPSAPPTPPPAPQPPAPTATPDKPRRRKWPLFVGLALLVLLVTVAGVLFYGRWRYNQIERVPVAVAPPGAGADVWMLVGSDSREGIDPDRPDAAAIIGEPVYGQRADTIILVRDMPGTGPQMLSLPRDLWFDPPGDNNATRINGAYASGPNELLQLLRTELGIRVHHYVEIDLAGLDRVVDAVGGVTVELPNPGYDESVGLFLTEPGPVTLDGATGLAFVRSRHWVDVIDGAPVADGRGDLGRVERQQLFLRALGDQLLSARNPLTLNRVADGLVASVRIDERTGLRQLLDFAGQLRAASSSEPLPVRNHVTAGGAHVLLTDEGAEQILDLYR